MAENEVHPGSFVGDSVEEFRRLPTWGKILAGIAFVFVAYLGYSQYRSGKATSTSGSATDTTASNQNGPMIGNVPVIPAGYNPVYNPTTGELQGYQPPTPNQPTGQPLQGGNPPNNGQVFVPPIIPYGQYKGPSYSNLRPNTFYNYNGTNYLLSTGAGNRLYGQANGTGQKVLLYGDVNAYRPIASPSVVQAGGSNGATQLPSTRLA